MVSACTARCGLLHGRVSSDNPQALSYLLDTPPVIFGACSDRLGVLAPFSQPDLRFVHPVSVTLGFVGFNRGLLILIWRQLASARFWPPGCGHPFTLVGVEAVSCRRCGLWGCSLGWDHSYGLPRLTKRVPLHLGGDCGDRRLIARGCGSCRLPPEVEILGQLPSNLAMVFFYSTIHRFFRQPRITAHSVGDPRLLGCCSPFFTAMWMEGLSGIEDRHY